MAIRFSPHSIVVAVLVVSLVLSGCQLGAIDQVFVGRATPSPPPPPTLAVDLPKAPQGEITLLPFTSNQFGFQGLKPEGWQEIAPGVYNRGSQPSDVVRLIQQAAPGATVRQLATALQGQLGVSSLPESSDTVVYNGLTWALYQIDVETPGVGTIKIELALTESESAAYLILLQTQEHDYASLRGAVFQPALQALAPAGQEAESKLEEASSSYTDPQNLFTVPIPTNWVVTRSESYARLASPGDEMVVHVMALENSDLEEAIATGWRIVDPNFHLEPDEVIDEPVTNGADRAITITYDTGTEDPEDDEPIILGGGWLYDDISYVELVETDLEGLQKRVYQLQIINTGFEIHALEQNDLSDVQPVPIDEALLLELETYLQEKMKQLDTVGAAMAIVQNGQILYAKGFGVKDRETSEPVTPKTMMMIGSTTKSMTTMLMAELVDEGVFDWDTRVQEVWPEFQVKDPDVSATITMRNMVCACSGVPRRDLEWLFNADSLTAEAVIDSLAEFEFFTEFGEAFQYSNQMVAAAGYLATLAAGGEYGTLYDDYLALFQDRMLEPMGMDRSTFSFGEVLAGADYATPYGTLPTGETVTLEMGVEEMLVPMAPAGALWSNVEDMAAYLITLLNRGITPAGEAIVSPENLAVTWEPQVAITADASYALGWIVEDYSGVGVLSHGGNTFGYSSELAFLPEHGIGISILTNQRASGTNHLVRQRFLELLFQQESELEPVLDFQLERLEESRSQLRNSLVESLDPEELAPYLGMLTHPVLGEIFLSFEDGALMLDAGEFKSEVRARRGEEGEISYGLYTPPLEGFPMEFIQDDDGNPMMVLGMGLMEYTFTRK